MISAPRPADEEARLAALRALQILDTPAEEAFERLTRVAARVFDVPIVQVSLVDEHREWFKSRCGTTAMQGDRAVAFCAHTILSNEVLIVTDALNDERFHDSPLVTGPERIRFYAGAPLTTASGLNLGAFCLKDHRPRDFSPAQAALLREFSAIVVDAMEHRLMALRAQAANEAKSRFLANMSHELRTPLNAILGYSEMLMEEAQDLGQENFGADLKKIHSAGKHLLDLINDILDLSKVEAGRMQLFLELFDVSAMIDEVVQTVQPLVSQRGSRLLVNIAPNVGLMRADQTKVRQSLFNLLSNASKFTENGQITLTVRRESAASPAVDDSTTLKAPSVAAAGAPIDGEWIVLSVRDSGIGMTAEQLKRLFQPFTQADSSTTRKYGGTGLGLAITRRFCELMGGTIAVESAVGAGSLFTVRLPAQVRDPSAPGSTTDSGAQPTLPGPSSDGDARHSRRALVIEDDPASQELLARMFDREGYAVRAAANGDDGLRLAREFHPHVITLDVMMPGRDGWSVLRELKADPQLRDIPVIMVTILDDRRMGFALGAAEFLTKPTDLDALTAVLRKLERRAVTGPVLVVEDDDQTREMERSALQRAGWTVVEAPNGRAALERVAAQRPAVVVLDLMMPEMDGFEFLAALRADPRTVDVPVLVMTAKLLSDDEQRRLTDQADAVLRKGAHQISELLETVRGLAATLCQPARIDARAD